jgi:hypothetical protein
MNTSYDQSCRYAAQLDGPGFLGWLLKKSELVFDRWLDTRTATMPGTGERTSDLVASLVVNGVGPWWAVQIEFQTTPDPEMAGRGLEMLGRLWRERRPPGDRGDRYQVGLTVVNLTGRGRASIDMTACGRRLGTRLRVIERNLAQESAHQTLAAVEAGTMATVVLPWIPLMQGGDLKRIIERWKALAERESNPRRRSDVTILTLTLAAAADRREAWELELEGWTVNESPYLVDLLKREMAPKLAELQAQRAALDVTKASLDAKEVSLDAKEVSLDAKEVSLDAKEVSLDAKEAALAARRAAVDAEKAALAARKAAVDAEEAVIIREKAKAVVALLRKLHPTLATVSAIERIKQEQDPAVLDRWLNLVIEGGSDDLMRELGM